MTLRRRLAAGCLMLASALPLLAVATPRVPRDDGEVLEHLAVKRGDPVWREQLALEAALSHAPRDAFLAARLARLHLDRSRREADPRQLGQAQAALQPWWNESQPPAPILLLRATLRQTQHQFAPALADLHALTAADPRNAQAWLTRATVEQVTGDLEAARQSCRRLESLAHRLVAVACTAAVEGAAGHASTAYDQVDDALQSDESPKALRAWVLTLQAELAERLARKSDAERAYRASLAAEPTDAYTLAAFSDFLLDSRRPADVIALIPADTPSDPLLLRRVLASCALHAADCAALTQRLRERFAASTARGDRVHLREEARFELDVENRPIRALALARDNWRLQKEPADVRLLRDAARVVGDAQAASEAREWIEKTRLELPLERAAP